jgi:hypothetical protein
VALSPSIPTSFVPKQSVPTDKKHYSKGNILFLIVALIIAGAAILMAGGVFLYEKYLVSVETSKGAELVAAQNQVNDATVEQFVRLRNRLTASQTLINQHVELSQFFALLESITLQNVHFTTLTVAVADDQSAMITMVGVATDFNALAAESTAFAQQPDVKSAIFSGITVNANKTVNFNLTATLSPGLVTESAPPTTPTLVPTQSSSAANVTPDTTSGDTTDTAPSTQP